MANRIPRRCAFVGCHEVGVFNGPYCDDHKAQSSREHIARRRYKIDERQWTALKDYLKGIGNVICQRVIDGERCRKGIWCFHHIVPVEVREDLAFTWENIVGLCHACHSSVEHGDPEAALYVPTLWRTPMSEEPVPNIVVMPGAMITSEQEAILWSLSNRLALFAERNDVVNT
jgi:HNH endonuclease